MKPIVFVDVDNTLFDLLGWVSEILLNVAGVKYEPGDVKRYERPWEPMLKLSDEEKHYVLNEKAKAVDGALQDILELLALDDDRELWWWAVRQVHELMWREPGLIEPYPGAVEGIREIRKRAGVVFTTTRPYPPYRAVVEPWIKHWFGELIAPINVAKDGYRKAEQILSQLRRGLWKWSEETDVWLPVVVIDDNPEVLRWVNGPALYRFSLRKPWAHQFPDGVVVAEDWEELARKVLEALR